MRTLKYWIVASLLVASVVVGLSISTVSAADGDQFLGAWKGSWEGGGKSGRYGLSFARASDGKLTGTVSVSSDSGDYNPKFRLLSFIGNRFTGVYDYTPNESWEMSVAGIFDPKNATGTWSLGAKGQPGGQAYATGTWKVSKQ